MRKSLWVLLALLVVAGAPVARANPYTVTFTCTYGCTMGPTAPAVTFPAPTLNVTFAGSSFTFNFGSVNVAGDTYTWSAIQTGGQYLFNINDVTTAGNFVQTVGSGAAVTAGGNLIFSAATTGATPEPGSIELIALGFAALLLVTWRRLSHAGASSV
jgi:hypothetical protein